MLFRKKGACDTPPFRVKTPLLGGTTINSFANDYGNLANLSISNPIFKVRKFQNFTGTQKLLEIQL